LRSKNDVLTRPNKLAYKIPKQKRSQKRFHLILKIAERIALKDGFKSLGLNQLAKEAAIPVGSVYQYFPTKEALICCMFEMRLKKFNKMAVDFFTPVQTKSDFKQVFRKMMAEIYHKGTDDKLMTEIWANMQIDPALRQIHREDFVLYQNLYYETLLRIGTTLDKEKLYLRCACINEMTDALIRQAFIAGDQKSRDVYFESVEISLEAFKLS